MNRASPETNRQVTTPPAPTTPPVSSPGMARLTIALPDDLAAKIRVASQGNVSAWLAGIARDAIMRDEAQALATWEQANRDDDWDGERWVDAA